MFQSVTLCVDFTLSILTSAMQVFIIATRLGLVIHITLISLRQRSLFFIVQLRRKLLCFKLRRSLHALGFESLSVIIGHIFLNLPDFIKGLPDIAAA